MSPQDISSLPVLLVDDEPSLLLSSRMVLRSAGIPNVRTIQDSRELMPAMTEDEPALVVLDLFMPYFSGIELLPEIVQRFPDVPVIVMTAAQEVETAVACMKEGAFDYLVKPVEQSRFVSSVKRALEVRTLRQQVGSLKRYLMTDHLEHGEAFASIITNSRRMRTLFQYLEAIAKSAEPVLITGETGVGKELLAQAVHRLSARTGRFVAVNVAGLDDTLFSDTLFGHKRGAYSGALGTREGMVAGAAGGTLFLDEIGDLAQASQVKLLRLLQDGQYYPLGSDVAKRSNVRVVCATNAELAERIRSKAFRSDLYYRLSVHQVEVPPLRERQEDIPALLGHFIEEAAAELEKGTPGIPGELLVLLANYHFPGNVRELRAMAYDAVARHQSGPILSMSSFRKGIRAQREGPAATHSAPNTRFATLKEAEAQHIREALRLAGGNQGIAATMLGISRPALNRRLANMNK
jgi:DNA-binding NtrC family response regulator